VFSGQETDIRVVSVEGMVVLVRYDDSEVANMRIANKY